MDHSFWRKTEQPLPGRASPKKQITVNKRNNGNPEDSSFKNYQDSVVDVWNTGDDDFCIVSDFKMSKEEIQNTARSVINEHKDGTYEKKNPVALEQSKEENTVIDSGLNKVPEVSRSVPGRPHLNKRRSQPGSRILALDNTIAKVEKLQALINGPNTNLEELRALSWSGVPSSVRPDTWRLLSGYLPANTDRREPTMKRKREEYWAFVEKYFSTRLDASHQDIFRQIHIDIPRMSPLISLFQQAVVQEMFERILYIWAIRHPASGYVQGINDLVTPFFLVFLQEFAPKASDIENFDVSSLSSDSLQIIEADAFWLLSWLLDGIQDNYTFAQPGIQSKIKLLKDLIQRVDVQLHTHLTKNEVDYLQFSFRWMNNLLMRELPLGCTIRLWDTCLSEEYGFARFHLYVCAAFLLRWRKEIMREADFQGLLMLLQNLPTHFWDDREISLLVAEAYQLKYMFADAPNHLGPLLPS
ncbi:TBC1 domain family member 22B-like [Artemia franciscana]|uniref:Rab-GAP TBC domain-containing protein n=1 Tax=Artemia franciscana TaxID=6661 RepID=A0AA88HFE9_ARTSF|nr:hypothetical protein QYM36_016487 [Artemia franciscana]KAK2706461.1 hypothetical protein QYM36_016487 [Artemia franciscana]